MIIEVKYRILISCPGDVGENFLQNIVDAVDNYNKNLSEFQSLFERTLGYIPSFETDYWVEKVVPELVDGKTAQDVIDEQLVNNVDGTIAFFYTRLGKETGSYPSGTVEEIEKTHDRKRPVSVVCIKPDTFPGDLLGDGKQYRKLQEYIESFESEKKGYVAIIPPDKVQATIKKILNSIIERYYDAIGSSIKELLTNFD